MKSLVPLSLLIVGIMGAGCIFHRHPHAVPPPAAAAPRAAVAPQPIVTPSASPSGGVVSYNAVGRFVVLNFPVGHVPAVGQGLFLYRNGLKTAEIKVTGPQRDENIVADIVSGDAQVGDEARSQ
jgi:hypothetical protein